MQNEFMLVMGEGITGLRIAHITLSKKKAFENVYTYLKTLPQASLCRS